MLSDVMQYYQLKKDFRDIGYFETEHHQYLFKEIKLAIKLGKLVALTGIIGSGKTVTMRKIQQELTQEKEILVSKVVSVEKSRANLGTLITALFYDLAVGKDIKIPSQPERRERKLQ